ncbi:MAG: DUF4124 domain-containing protein [Pseudomonadota bacterium]
MHKVMLFLVSVMLLVTAPVSAQVFKCTDAAGKIQYTDTPCGETSTAIKKHSAPPAAASPDERMQRTRRLLDAMEAERNEEKRTVAEAKAEKQRRIKNCHVARDRYRQLISAGRLYDLDKDGNRVILNDAQRAQTEAGAKADMDTWCD